jgi:hypothetical protein
MAAIVRACPAGPSRSTQDAQPPATASAHHAASAAPGRPPGTRRSTAGPVSCVAQVQRAVPGLIRHRTCGHHQRGLHHLQLERRRLLLALQQPKHGLVAAELAHEPRALRGPGTSSTFTRDQDQSKKAMSVPPRTTHPRAALGCSVGHAGQLHGMSSLLRQALRQAEGPAGPRAPRWPAAAAPRLPGTCASSRCPAQTAGTSWRPRSPCARAAAHAAPPHMLPPGGLLLCTTYVSDRRPGMHVG